ncbi:MAG: hypothetical protein HQL51_03735 [Magnetococcales bacterium]|nr:hypothetical protein [Magnetococcales bacterium]
MGRFVVLSGPSCIGKGPLVKALKIFHPHLVSGFQQVILYNDRAPRPGEVDGVDYHFRPRAEIERFRGDPGYVVADVRGDLQALELGRIQAILDQGGTPFFEGNPFIPAILRQAGVFDRYPALTVFLSPLSREEVLALKNPALKADLPALVADVQRRKLLHRTTRQKTYLSFKDLENIEKRCGSAYNEMKEACHFDWVIPNHDGEGNDNWDALYFPVGDARKTLEAFAGLLRGEQPHGRVEKWEPDLLP